MSDALTQFAKHAVCAIPVLGDAETARLPRAWGRQSRTQEKASWRRGTLDFAGQERHCKKWSQCGRGSMIPARPLDGP